MNAANLPEDLSSQRFSALRSVYLDYAATTPTDSHVLEAMLPFLSGPGSLGNASSIHRYGREARAAVDEAREAVAHLVGADYSELYFTGSGTEAANLAIIGTMRAAPPERNHFVTTAIEHHAVLHTAHFLQTQGYDVTIVGVDHKGLVAPEAIAEAITDRTALVSVMHANNEIGTIQPIAAIARIAHERGAKFHTDAVQTAGQLAVNVHELDCNLLSFCAHKMYGPKGIAALAIAQGTKVSPILHGGAQEREKRPGTENVAAIVGFGKAAQLLTTSTTDSSLSNTAKQVPDKPRTTMLQSERFHSESLRITAMRDDFLTCLRQALSDLQLNGHPEQRLPNNVNVSVPNGLDAMGMDTGMPDLTNFPVPRLFFLGRITGSLTSFLYYGGMDVNTDGKLRDQWNINGTIPGINGLVNPRLYVDNTAPVARGRGILTTAPDPADATKTLLQALLSPTPYLSIFGNAPTFDCSDGEYDLNIHTHGFALELTDTKQTVSNNGGASVLELFGHPKARGDGKNQFVYDTTGALYLPVGINVNGAQGDVSSDDTSYLIHSNKVQVVSDITYTQPLNSTYVVPQGAPTTIVPQTSLAMSNYNGLVYTTMPASNQQMGNHQVALQVNLKDVINWQTSEVANIQTFFMPKDFTHAAGTLTPNWFWYYSNADKTSVYYGGPSSNIPGGGSGSNDYTTIKIYDGALGPRQLNVFGIYKDANNKRYVKKSGTLDISGIYSYIKVVGHELAHIAHHTAGIEGGLVDVDGDGVLDSWEAHNNFDPKSNDTSGEYIFPMTSPDFGKGDRECLADIDALAYLVAAHQQKAWQQDWAVQGLQWGKVPPSMPGRLPFFPWTYTPYNRSTMTYGTPTGTLPPNGPGNLIGLSKLDGGGI